MHALKLCEQLDMTVHHMKLDLNDVPFTGWLVDDLRLIWENIIN